LTWSPGGKSLSQKGDPEVEAPGYRCKGGNTTKKEKKKKIDGRYKETEKGRDGCKKGNNVTKGTKNRGNHLWLKHRW